MVQGAGGRWDNQPHHSVVLPLAAFPERPRRTRLGRLGLSFSPAPLIPPPLPLKQGSIQVVAEVKLGEGATAAAAGRLSASELHA